MRVRGMTAASTALVMTLVFGGGLPVRPAEASSLEKRSDGAAQMAPQTGTTPEVGDRAHTFTLKSVAGTSVSLTDKLGKGPVVLLMMRGWPGYQCPFCTRQFGDYLKNAEALQAAGAEVIFVYPGPAEGLDEHAAMFLNDQEMPAHFSFLVDPDYDFTNRYGLRWDAPRETSYPTTFVLDATGTVRFVETSREHGGRVPVSDVLRVISEIGG